MSIIQKSLNDLDKRAQELKQQMPFVNPKTIDEVIVQHKYKIAMLTFINDDRKN